MGVGYRNNSEWRGARGDEVSLHYLEDTEHMSAADDHRCV